MDKNIFRKYFKRLTLESILKSLILSVMISSVITFVLSFVTWYFGKLSIVPVLAFVAVFVISFIVSFFVVYKMNTKKIAKRIDGLGLKERVITMIEFENEDSIMVSLQREDAMGQIKTVNSKLIKMAFSIPLVIVASIGMVLSIGMVTTSYLAQNDVISSGSEIIAEINKVPPVYYSVRYKVDGDGGIIVGNSNQNLNSTEKGDSINVELAHDFAFIEWNMSVKGNPFGDSLVEGPFREDSSPSKNVTVSAVIERVNYVAQDRDTKDDQIGSYRVPFDPEQQKGGDQNNGYYKPQKDRPSTSSGEQSTSKYDIANQVYDGSTYYGGNTYDTAYDDAMADLTLEGEVPDVMREFIEDYYKRIEE